MVEREGAGLHVKKQAMSGCLGASSMKLPRWELGTVTGCHVWTLCMSGQTAGRPLELVETLT